MKKHGFTLIETAASMAVILIIISCVISMSKIGMKVINDIKVRSCVYDVHNLLTYAKAKCRLDDKCGKIIINYRDNSVKFKENDNVIKKVQMPDDARLTTKSSSTSMEDNIAISNEGKIKKGYTVGIFNGKDIRYEIAISVGVDNITIKEEEIWSKREGVLL